MKKPSMARVSVSMLKESNNAKAIPAAPVGRRNHFLTREGIASLAFPS